MSSFWRGFGSLACLTATATLASAAEPVQQCITAYESAQVERDQGHLTRARELLLTCSGEPCPTVIRQDCREWLFELESRVPTLVLRARLADGADLADVRVLVDGAVLAERLDGLPVRLDPGERVLVWEHAGHRPVRTRVVVREGEKNRFVSAVFPTPAASGESSGDRPQPHSPQPEPVSRGALPVGPLIAGGVSLAGFATFAVLGISVDGRESEFEDTCAPRCTPSRVEALQRDAAIANVALGVGIAGAVVTAWLLLATDSDPRPPTTAFDVHVAPGSAAAFVTGQF